MYFTTTHALSKILLLLGVVATVLVSSMFVVPVNTNAATSAAPNQPVAQGITAAAGQLDQEPAGSFGCMSGGPTEMVKGCGALFAYYFMKAGAYVAVWVSVGLNYVIAELVVGMGKLVGNMPGVFVAWAVLRDLANIFLVFLTIFVGIATIVGASGYGYKQLLWKIVLAALFVNFSITLAKGVIDVSNVVAIETYKMLITENAKTGATTVGTNCALPIGMPGNDPVHADNTCITTGVAGIFWSKLKIMQVFNIKELREQSKNIASATTSALMWVGLMGGLMFFVMAFVFGAATLLLMVRFAILIFLIVVSPIAFVLWVTGVSGQGRKWWGALLKQSFFAPAIFICWWIAYMTFSGLAARFNLAGGIAGSAMADIGAIGIVTYFFITIALLVASLSIARSMGAAGATMAMNTGNRWARRVGMAPINLVRGTGRHVGGHVANAVANEHRAGMAHSMRTDEHGNYVNNSVLDRANRGAVAVGLHGAIQRRLDSGGSAVRGRQQQRRADRADLANENRRGQLDQDANLVNEYAGVDARGIEARALNARREDVRSGRITREEARAQARAEAQRVQDARGRVGRASQQDLEGLRQRNRRAFEGEGVSTTLTGTQMDAMRDNPEFAGDQSAAQIRAHRQAAHERAVTADPATLRTNVAAAQRATRNMSEDERRTAGRAVDAGASELRNLERIASRPGATAAEINAYLEAQATLDARIQAMEPKDILHLSDNAITQDYVTPHLTARHLETLHDNNRLSEAQRRTLRTRILGSPVSGVAVSPSAIQFLNGNKGRTWV